MLKMNLIQLRHQQRVASSFLPLHYKRNLKQIFHTSSVALLFMSLLIANVLFLGPWDLYLFSFRSPNFIFFNYILASSINRLLSTSIFTFSHISYLFKYSYTELEINYFNRPNPVTIKVSSPPACSSFSAWHRSLATLT